MPASPALTGPDADPGSSTGTSSCSDSDRKHSPGVKIAVVMHDCLH